MNININVARMVTLHTTNVRVLEHRNRQTKPNQTKCHATLACSLKMRVQYTSIFEYVHKHICVITKLN